jgi:hypothetical protein
MKRNRLVQAGRDGAAEPKAIRLHGAPKSKAAGRPIVQARPSLCKDHLSGGQIDQVCVATVTKGNADGVVEARAECGMEADLPDHLDDVAVHAQQPQIAALAAAFLVGGVGD